MAASSIFNGQMGALANSAVPLGPDPNTYPWIEISDYTVEGWRTPAAKSRALHYCHCLEAGQILFFRRPPFAFPSRDRDQLIHDAETSQSRLHKNISYRPQSDRLRGYSGSSDSSRRIHEILHRYSQQVTQFVFRFLLPYASKLSCDYASFRPVEEENRSLSLHQRNDLLHVDAFPSRPTHGSRILRVFTNLHPFRDRVWNVLGSFASLAGRYAAEAGLHDVTRPDISARLAPWLHPLGVPIRVRAPYDRFMLRLHDFMKEHAEDIAQLRPHRIAFPPASTWLVFTDGVPHAALSGQFAVEQTFIVPVKALASPQNSPLRILEKLAGQPLA